MKHITSVIAFSLTGLFVQGTWNQFVDSLGFIGGFLAAGISVGTMWYLDHYLHFIYNPDGHAFVDMGLGISMAAFFRDAFHYGIDGILSSTPTLLLVIAGAVLGGLVAASIEITQESEENNIQKKLNKTDGSFIDLERTKSS